MSESIISSLTYEEVEYVTFQTDYVQKNIPLVLSQACTNWNAFKEWRPHVIVDNVSIQRHENEVLDVACKEKKSLYFYGDESLKQSVKMKFKSFLNLYTCQANKENNTWAKDIDLDFYLCQCPIKSNIIDEKEILPSLYDDMQFPKLLQQDSLLQINLWMSITESKSNLHYDSNHNLLFVIHGCKRITLFPPSDQKDLCPKSIYHKSMHHSLLSVEQVRTTKNLLPRHCTIQEGDALFIPEGWWHQVDSDPCTLAVNIWFRGIVKDIVDKNMETYVIRTLMQKLLQDVKTKEIQAWTQNQSNPISFSGNENHHSNTISNIQETTLQFLANNTQENVEMYIKSMSPSMINQILPLFAKTFANRWMNIIENSTPPFIEYLTGLWENNNDDFYRKIFEPWEVNGMEKQLSQMILNKKEMFCKQCFSLLINETLGESKEEVAKNET